jgi:hypothetical protein
MSIYLVECNRGVTNPWAQPFWDICRMHLEAVGLNTILHLNQRGLQIVGCYGTYGEDPYF